MAKLSLLLLALLMLGGTLLLSEQFTQHTIDEAATEQQRAKELAREVAMIGLGEARQAAAEAFAVEGAYAGPRVRDGQAQGGTYQATLRPGEGGVTIRVHGQHGVHTYRVERRYRFEPGARYPRLRGQLHHLPR